MFAIVAATAMFATSLNLTTVSAASFSNELQGAYEYSYGIGITTQSSIDSANMYGNLLRAHMAKMMVAYAKEVKGMKADTSVKVNFTDIAGQSAELQGYIVEAAQMGLMGINSDGSVAAKFNPTGVVTRAEFGTVLDRVINGNANNGGTPYYAAHLSALKAAGIMTNIATPNANEVRGYVMLMMQRGSTGGTTPATCSTAENILACSIGVNCPAECVAAPEVKAGSLNVSSLGVDYSSIPKTGLVKFGAIKFAANGTDITVNSVKIKNSGLSSLTGSTQIFFEKNGVRVSSKATFTNNEATVSFTTPLVVKSSDAVDVILNLNGSAGDEYQLSSTLVTSSAQDVNGTWTSALLKATSYSVLNISAVAVANALSTKVDASKVIEVGQLNITKSDSNKAAIVKTIVLNNSGTSDLTNLQDVAVYRDDVKVSTSTAIDGRKVSFVLNDEIKTTQTSAVSYVIKAKLVNADRIGDTINLYVRNTEDVTVIEKDTSFRTNVSYWLMTMGLISVSGGDVKFVSASTTSLNVVPGTTHVVLAEGTIQSLQNVTLNKFVITGTAGTGFDKILTNLYIKIGSTIIAADSIPAATTAGFVFDGQASINGTVAFQIYGDIKSDAPATTITALPSFNLNNVTGIKEFDNGQAVTSGIGSIDGRSVTIADASLTLSNSSASTKTVQRGDKNVEIAKLEFATTSDVISKLYSFKATVTGSNYGMYDGAQVTVYDANGNALVSDTVRTGSNTLTFVLPSYMTVAKAMPVNLTVKLDQVPSLVNTGGYALGLTFNNLVAKDMINQNPVGASLTQASTTLTSVAGGSVSVITQTYNQKLIKAGDTAIIGAVNLKAFNGDAVLKTMTLNGVDTTKLSSIKLLDNNVAIATFVKTGSALEVTNLNQTIAVGSTKAYQVQATFSSANTSGDLVAPFTLTAAATFESPYGVALAPLTTTAISNTGAVVNEVPTITSIEGIRGSNYASYKVVLNSTKQVQLTKLVAALGANLSTLPGTGNVILSSSEGGNGTVYGTAQNWATTATFNGVSIDVIGSTTLYITVTGVTWSATNGTPYVFVGLSDFDYSDKFDDTSVASHASMLTQYKTSLTTISDLGKEIK